MPFVLFTVLLLALLVIWLVGTYNKLVALRNKAEESWSGIDVQLRRRADLVPNLVETVKGYATHEEGLFTRIAQARAAMSGASSPQDADTANTQLGGALKSLFAVAEDYPDLQASTNFLQLQRQLAEIEEELAFARRYYNATVEDLNTATETFPSNLIANAFGFERRAYFDPGGDAFAVPRVDLDR